MPVSRLTAIVFVLGLLTVGAAAAPAPAADAPRACLTKAEQRDAIAERKAIPLAAAVKALRERGRHAEVVRASLCRRDDRLVYELTLLGRSGRVTRAVLDAASGAAVSGL